jgi:hypothetical protein
MEGRDHSEDLAEDGWVILEWIFEKWYGKVYRLGFIWFRIGTSGGIL